MNKKCIYQLFMFLCAAGMKTSVQAQDSASRASDSLPAASYINVAYGKVAKDKIMYAANQIGNKDIINNSVYSTGNSLYGKIPGLFVIQRTGEPGNDAPTLYLRGTSTTRVNAPLVIVDGIERDLNHVPVEDIEAIAALKDAASSAIYGIRGANGVILVTTKRGAEGKLSLNANVEQGLLSPVRTPRFVSSAAYAKLYNQALANDGIQPVYTQEQIAGYEKGNSYNYPDVDWQRELTKDYANATRANINISGGEKVARYFVSLGYFRQGGIYKNTDNNEGYSTNINLNNFSFRSNLDLNVNKNWKVGLDIAGRIYEKNEPYNSTANIWDVMYKYPSHLFPVYVQDNIYGGTAYYYNNPVGYVNGRGYRQTNNRVIQSTLFTRYNFSDVIDGLSAGLKYSADNFYSNEEGYTKSFGVMEPFRTTGNGQPVLSSLIGTNTNLTSITNSGYPTNDVQNKRSTFEGDLRYAPYIGQQQNLNAQIIYHQDRLIIGSESPYNFQFLSGRVSYDLNRKYLAEFVASYSGTEAFPQNKRYGFFPAGSLGWVISEESFLKSSKVFDFLKLRLSAGSVGNASVGERFSNIQQYISGSAYNFGNSNASQPGLSSGILPNPGFTWETAFKYDVGIDARLFKAIDLTFTYFNQERKDILISDETITPSIIGADLANINAATIKSNGVEGSLFWKKDQNDWGYHAGINISYAANKITHMPEPRQPYTYLYKTGQPLNQPFLLEAIGFFESDADIRNSPVQQFGNVKPGDIKYKDQNGDGRINEFDQVPVKNTSLPKLDAGFDLGLRYKFIEISAFFQGQAGRSIYLGTEPLLFWPLTNNGARITSYANNFWTPQTKDIADYPRLTTIENYNNYRPSTFWYVNGDFIRLRSLNISCHLPQSVLRHAKLKNATIYLTGMNLFTLDHLKYTDPEVLSGYPVMKSYNAGIRLWF